jgi:hypothetical protein
MAQGSELRAQSRTDSPFEEPVPRIRQPAEKREGEGDVYKNCIKIT